MASKQAAARVKLSKIVTGAQAKGVRVPLLAKIVLGALGGPVKPKTVSATTKGVTATKARSTKPRRGGSAKASILGVEDTKRRRGW